MPYEQDTENDDWSLESTREEDNAGGNFELPPEDMYTFELVGKDADAKQDAKFDPTGTKKRARFHFVIVDDEDWEGTKISQFYNLTLNEKGYFLPVVEALLGRPLEPKEKVGLNPNPAKNQTGLKGLRMKGTLRHDKKEDGRVFGRIESPLPVRQKKGKTKTETAAPADQGPAPF